MGERERVRGGGGRARQSAARGEGRGRQQPPAIGRGRRRCCVDRGARQGASGRERGKRGSRAPTGGPAQHSAEQRGSNSVSNRFKIFKRLE
jgi:hypothetical protein